MTPLSDADLMFLSAVTASSTSADPATQNGAALMSYCGRVVTSANVLPRGVAAERSRLTRPQKYKFIEHAERAVIFRAAEAGIATSRSKMCCLWAACASCARAIAMSGVSEVICHAALRERSPARWVDEIAAGDAILREAGVTVRLIEEQVGVEVMFDGVRILI